ncbi:hypothetical protein V1517DRAFT_318528 [Lipomyces orientalis]|uniref:Uncharacterized protein n=1 Tax=Lipomyces orientalis TaxID=1233043 RepID=A0ACC3TV15_9ASCO
MVEELRRPRETKQHQKTVQETEIDILHRDYVRNHILRVSYPIGDRRCCRCLPVYSAGEPRIPVESS